jgi:Mg2+/Co2+ transporter CorB
MLVEFLWGVLVLVLLGGSAYLAACETAVTAYSRPRIFNMVRKGNKRACVILELQEEIDLVISSILAVNTILNALVVSFANSLCIDLFGESAILYCPIITSVFIVLFAEVLPKTFTISDPERVLLVSAHFIKCVHVVTKPLNNVIGFIAKKLISLIKPGVDERTKHESSIEELRGAIDLHVGSDRNNSQEKEMLQSILDLGDVQVCDIMVHRKNVMMLCADSDNDTIIRSLVNCPFTRIPLWQGTSDNIVGVLHVKDVLRSIGSGRYPMRIADIAINPWFIPENKKLLDQLQSFKSRREHFAVIVDEYGSFVGIITLEDIIEEIVGDISDEHDVASISGIRKQDDGSYIVDGSVSLRDINREIGSEFKSVNSVTLAGFVIDSIGIIPNVGQAIEILGYRFEVLRRNKTQVTLLKVNILQ